MRHSFVAVSGRESAHGFIRPVNTQLRQSGKCLRSDIVQQARPWYTFRIMIKYTLITSLIASLALAFPAAAKSQRPVQAPLPNPMPRVAQMPGEDQCEQQNAANIAASGDSAFVIPCDVAGFYDGETIWLADPSYRFGRAHELGHVFDEQFMDAGERQRFASIQSELWDDIGGKHEKQIGSNDSDHDPWFSVAENLDGTVTTAYGDLGEIFADAYAACRLRMVRGSNHTWETGYGYEPGAAQHRRICKLIYNAGQDRGVPAKFDENGYAWR